MAVRRPIRLSEWWPVHGFSAEAAAWRERIAVWRRFGRIGEPQPPKPVADPLLDDPDPFLL